MPNASTCTEWSITSSAGTSGLIFAGVPAHLGDRVAHRREVDDRRHAGEVLHQHTSRAEGDLLARLRPGVPARERLDVGGADRAVCPRCAAGSRAAPSARTAAAPRRSAPAARPAGRSRTPAHSHRACSSRQSCPPTSHLPGRSTGSTRSLAESSMSLPRRTTTPAAFRGRRAPSAVRRCAIDAPQTCSAARPRGRASFLISGPAAASTCVLVSGMSKPSFGVGLLPTSRSIAAAWRASTCTMLPAAASTCLLWTDGAAPL